MALVIYTDLAPVITLYQVLVRTKTGGAAIGPGTAVITATSEPIVRRHAGFAEQLISR